VAWVFIGLDSGYSVQAGGEVNVDIKDAINHLPESDTRIMKD